jgi:hypothetical protein
MDWIWDPVKTNLGSVSRGKKNHWILAPRYATLTYILTECMLDLKIFCIYVICLFLGERILYFSLL